MRRRRYSSSRWPDYVPVAERRRDAARLTAKLANEGREIHPVRVEGKGHKIAKTFWGSSWCENLERYSDYASRLPRGRTYVRNGSVIDLQVESGVVAALVTGSEIYTVKIIVEPLSKAQWRELRADCANGIDSLVELLQGKFSDGVMEVLCRPSTGMFPEPDQLSLSCSCPDWAVMCKHVAATLYGIGARLDQEPELLFTLRQVDHTELISARDGAVATATADDVAGELAGEDLGAIFGIELAAPESRPARSPRKKKAPTKRPNKKKKPTGKARKGQPARDPRITAAELRQRGVPNHVVQAWLKQGQVEHSGERGIYIRDKGVEALVKAYLAGKQTRRGT